MAIKGYQLTVGGLSQVKRRVLVLGTKLARGPLRRGMTKAVRLLTKAAKGEVPVETATLQKSLGNKVKAFRDNSGYYGLVGARKDAKAKPGVPVKPRFSRHVMRPSKRAATGSGWGWAVPHKYLHLVEKGTRPHAVGAGSSLRTGVQKPPFHPGARKNPFLERTLNNSRRAVVDTVANELRKEMRSRGWWW